MKNVCDNDKHISNRAFLAFLLDQVIICHKQMKENSENITFFANHKDVAEKYCEWLLADLRLEHKRFYTMATRLLSYTDFYKVIDRKELYLDKEHFKNLRIFEDQFLPYDNIGTYFKDICGK